MRPANRRAEGGPKARKTGGGLTPRLFLVAVLVALLTAAGATAVFLLLAVPEEDHAGADALDRSSSAETYSVQERLLRLRLVARRLADEAAADATVPGLLAAGARSDAGGAAPVAGVAGSPDLLTAWLLQQRGALGYDLALLAEPGGRVLARTDRAPAPFERLTGSPLLAGGAAVGERAGAWASEGKLYLAAGAPIVRDFDLLGHTVVALAVDDLLALEIERMGGADVSFAVLTPEGPRLAGASHDAASAKALLVRLGGDSGSTLGSVLAGAAPLARSRVESDGRRLDVVVTVLRDAADQPAGAAVFAAPVAETRALTPVYAGLAAAALLALLLTAPLIYFVGRRSAGPVGRLAALLEAGRRGDYGARVDAGSAGPLAPIAAGLDGLFADLREREALAAVTDAALAPDGAPGEAPAAEERTVALLAVDLRAYAAGRVGLDARETGERLARDLARIGAAAASHGGRLEATLGHRVLVSFAGDDRSYRAVAAGADTLVALARGESAFDEVEPPAAAVAAGKVVCGEAVVGGALARTVVGGAVQLLDSLLREAGAGELLLAPAVHRELAARLGEQGVAVEPRRALLSPQQIFPLGLEAAARLAGVEPGAAPAAGAADAWTEPSEATVSGPSELGAGDRLGDRFEILTLVGSSSAGSLFRARDRELSESIALKVFAPGELADPDLFDRLDSALQRARKLVAPHVARTYDFGRAGGLAFLAREFVAGVPLEELLGADERLPLPAVLHLARQLTSALAQAHAEGLAHGRLTPRNLILEPGGRLKVTDFGVAVAVRPAPGLGGPLAPELAAGAAASARADVYAVGALVQRALSGAWPGAGEAAALPAAVAGVVAGCLDRDPGKRYADGGALSRALDDVRA